MSDSDLKPDIDLADLESKARAATPGPWEATELVVHPSFNAPNQPFVEADGRKVARMSVGPGGDDVVAATFCTIGKYEREQANAAFIAAANPAVVLALVERLRRAEVVVAAAERLQREERVSAMDHDSASWELAEALAWYAAPNCDICHVTPKPEVMPQWICRGCATGNEPGRKQEP